MNKEIACWLVPSKATEACMSHQGDWTTLQDQLLSVVNSSELGSRLFWKQSQNVLRLQLSKCAKNVVGTLFGQPVTEEKVSLARKAFEGKLTP